MKYKAHLQPQPELVLAEARWAVSDTSGTGYGLYTGAGIFLCKLTDDGFKQEMKARGLLLRKLKHYTKLRDSFFIRLSRNPPKHLKQAAMVFNQHRLRAMLKQFAVQVHRTEDHWTLYLEANQISSQTTYKVGNLFVSSLCRERGVSFDLAALTIKLR